MRLIVQKYGGTSVGTAERIRNVARRLVEVQREGSRVVAVISAMAGVTDDLIKLAYETSEQPAERELDILLATGEHAATALVAMADQQRDVRFVATRAVGSAAGIQAKAPVARALCHALNDETAKFCNQCGAAL